MSTAVYERPCKSFCMGFGCGKPNGASKVVGLSECRKDRVLSNNGGEENSPPS